MPANDDEKIWLAYAKGVKPFAGQKPPKPAPRTKSRSTASPVTVQPAWQTLRTEAHVSLSDNPLDRNIERRLRKGDIEIDARIDLHGMRQSEARNALDDFVARQVKAGRRCLLIITGKGRGGEGVLRANLENWLINSPHAAQMLALRSSAPQHGGSGAFYVLLKRKTRRTGGITG
jgi:DNA-nicking Smr family endonuclease